MSVCWAWNTLSTYGRFISKHKKFCKNSFLTLTQSCFSCLATSSLGCPSFQAVKSVLHVASDVPIVPPVNVKLVPSENVYVPSVVLEEDISYWLRYWWWWSILTCHQDRPRSPPRSCSGWWARWRWPPTWEQQAFRMIVIVRLSTCSAVVKVRRVVSFGAFFSQLHWVLNSPLHSIFREAGTRITCSGVIHSGRLHPDAKTLCNSANWQLKAMISFDRRQMILLIDDVMERDVLPEAEVLCHCPTILTDWLDW